MSLNKILIIGHLEKDPEIRYLPSGKPTANFSVAANHKYKTEGEVKEETEWFNIVAYGRLAEICSEFLKKGRPVFIEGRLKTRNWVDSNGNKHYRTEVIAEGMRLIGSRPNGSGESTADPIVAETDDEPAF